MDFARPHTAQADDAEQSRQCASNAREAGEGNGAARGVSRGHFPGALAFGSIPQALGWTGMMKGISETIRHRGGRPKENSFKVEKIKRASQAIP
jgi:hypothetical protein